MATIEEIINGDLKKLVPDMESPSMGFLKKEFSVIVRNARDNPSSDGYKEAIEIGDKIIGLAKKLKGYDKLDLAMDYSKLARVYLEAGRIESSANYLTKAKEYYSISIKLGWESCENYLYLAESLELLLSSNKKISISLFSEFYSVIDKFHKSAYRNYKSIGSDKLASILKCYNSVMKGVSDILSDLGNRILDELDKPRLSKGIQLLQNENKEFIDKLRSKGTKIEIYELASKSYNSMLADNPRTL